MLISSHLLLSLLSPLVFVLLRGMWVAAQTEAERLEPLDTSAASWHPQWGDRCQQIVWIGIAMDREALTAMLDACLLTDEEMALGPEGWAEVMEDELPEWGVVQQEGEEEEGEEG